jgi:DivIVA domain-containing protein
VPIDPAVVRAQEFRVVFRGYDVEEVDAFLDWIEQQLAAPAETAAPADPAHRGASARAARLLLHAEQAAEQVLAEAADEAAAIRQRAHAEAQQIVADARAAAAHLATPPAPRPSADVEDLVARARRLRAELDRLDESERRCREQLQTWLADQGRLVDGSPASPDAERAADPYRRDTGTTVRRVATTLPIAAVR